MNIRVDFKTAVVNGLAPDGGLYMPERIPRFEKDFFKNLAGLSLAEIGFMVLEKYAEEIPPADLEAIVNDAINFPTPLQMIEEYIGVLELFHGPTLAFKDYGARFLARLLQYYQQGEDKELVILVATSGDTGSAVANGFLGMEGIKVGLLYPSGMVSRIQEKQLTTIGGNVTAFEVRGTFDDCQRLVKTAFTDADLRSKFRLSSANSINLARLLPQSFYYFSAFGQGGFSGNHPPIICVPSGNFGNLTAGLIAGEMGLPVKKYIAAVNANRVFSDYLSNGRYQPRPTIQTFSNAMDVGDPSNFMRILALFAGNLQKVRERIASYSITDSETLIRIKKVCEKKGYILDPHGAVGYEALKRYRNDKKDNGAAIVLETAHPAKFADIVGQAVDKQVPMPPVLQQCLQKNKQAIPSPAEYQSFKEIFINNF